MSRPDLQNPILLATVAAVILALAAIAFFASGCGGDSPCTINVYPSSGEAGADGAGCSSGEGGSAGGGPGGISGAAGMGGFVGEGGAGGEDCDPYRR